MCYRNHFVLLYTIMDYVSEIFRCFCWFFFLTIQFLFSLLFSVQPVYFLFDRTFNIVWTKKREEEQVRESSFIFLMIFWMRIIRFIHVYFCWLLYEHSTITHAFVSNANICRNFIHLSRMATHPVLHYSSIFQVVAEVCVCMHRHECVYFRHLFTPNLRIKSETGKKTNATRVLITISMREKKTKKRWIEDRLALPLVIAEKKAAGTLHIHIIIKINKNEEGKRRR